MLRCNTLFAAAEPRELAPFLQFLDGRSHCFPSSALWTKFLPCDAD
jgi:hypothetical protein